MAWADVAVENAHDLSHYTAIDTRAFVSVPLVREGRLRATLFVNDRQPRAWSAHELAMIENTAARIWDSVSRAQVEQLLRASEVRLQASEDRLQHGLDATQAGIFDWNIGSGEIVWSDSHYALLGLEVNSQPASYELWRRHVHPEDIERVERSLNKAIAAEGRYQADFRVVRSDGVERWMQGNGILIKHPGQPLRMVGSIVDITERKQSEQALREQEQQLRLATEAAEVGLWDVDMIADKLFWPPRVKAMFGISADVEVSMADFFAGLHPEDSQRTSESYNAAIDPIVRGLYDVEYRTVGKEDGLIRWVAAKGRGIFDSAGKCVRVIGTAIDITARKLVEEQLRRREAELQAADRQKDEFLAMLAHELRNPLAPIRTAAQLLASPKLEPEQLHWAQKVIKRQSGRMALLLDDLLDISRITQGKLFLKKERVALMAVVDSAVESARPLIDGKNHSFAVSLPPDVFLEADPLRLSQALSNLLTNAAKYTDPAGHIELVGIRTADTLCLSVRDDGIGIPADMMDRIFDMFSQVDGSSQRSDGGLGIGLALVKGLVELHGGTIEAKSEGVGLGSIFTMRLPVIGAESIDIYQPPDPISPPAITRKILIADDNKDAAEMLAALLEFDSHEVRVVHNGRAALTLAQTFRPDVMLLDIGMPELDGYEVAKALRQEPWGAKIFLIALTGWGQEDDRRRSKDAGFDQHMTKPIDADTLELLLSASEGGTSQPPP